MNKIYVTLEEDKLLTVEGTQLLSVDVILS